MSMRLTLFLVLLLVCRLILLTPETAFANDMISNNKAYGYVGGDIVQIVSDGAESRIDIGSIRSSRAANNNVRAHVNGGITVITEKKDLVLSIGSVQDK